MLRPASLALITAALIALAYAGGGGASPRGKALALATSLAVDECVEVESGETFTVTISVSGVTNLLAWDIYYAYDPEMLEVIGKDVRLFLDEEPNSNVFDFSDPVPNTTGVYHLGAADTGGDGTAEDGGGSLAVITLRAREDGISWSSLLRLDADDDGAFDFGPTLTETGGGHIGDNNADGVFDGAVSAGQIAVGRGCKDPAPTPFVDESVIPKPVVNTPIVNAATPTPTLRPDGSTPEPEPGPGDTGGPGGTGEPDDDGGTTLSPRRSATPTPRDRTDGSGVGDSDSGGGGFSPLLAALLGAAGGAGIIGSYVMLKIVRRPS